MSTTLHAVGTVSTGAAIALVGQIFNIQEHWPAAILLWAIAALAGWALLHDEAQQTLTLLLFPAWIFCELQFYTERHIGQGAYLGRFLFVWAIFYLTMFLGSRRKVVHGILFAVAAISAVAGTVMMTSGWASWSASQTVHPVWNALLGVDGHCRRAAGDCRIQGTLGSDPAGIGGRTLPSLCPGASASGSSTTNTATGGMDRSPGATPICLLTCWSLLLLFS